MKGILIKKMIKLIKSILERLLLLKNKIMLILIKKKPGRYTI